MAKGFAGMCCVYEDDTWLSVMVQGCYPALERLYFLVGKRPWNGQPGSNESTIAAIRACPDPESKIVVVEGDWNDEAEERNYGLDVCCRDGFQFCVIVDSDEIYDPGVLDMMLEVARLQADIQAWSISQITYWKSYRYKIDSNSHNGQLAIVRLGETRFVNARGTTATKISYIPAKLGVCHHLSYARTNEAVKKKMAHSSHANIFMRDWYEAVWLRWDEDPMVENLHPFRPSWYPRAILQNPGAYPPALREIYDRDVRTGNTEQARHASVTP